MQNAQRVSIILLLCCLSHAAFSQNYLYIGTQRYPSIYLGRFGFPGDASFRRDFFDSDLYTPSTAPYIDFLPNSPLSLQLRELMESRKRLEKELREEYSRPALSVKVAKRNGGGWLVISTYCKFCGCGLGGLHFSGDVYLYLSDGSVIKCYDRGLRDCLNDDIIGIYMLSAAEIMRLKQHSIESIRFTIGLPGGFSTKDNSFIATSSEDTRQPIRQLFGN